MNKKSLNIAILSSILLLTGCNDSSDSSQPTHTAESETTPSSSQNPLASEDQINAEKKSYYQILEQTQKGDLDITE